MGKPIVKQPLKIRGYAIRVIEPQDTEQSGVCYTDTRFPFLEKNGIVWQIYKTREDAEAFLKVPFDCEYEIVPVWITSDDPE